MDPYEHNDHKADDWPTRHHNLAFWFYEQRGSRYYLRLTRLGVAIIVIPAVLSMLAIAIIFFYQVNNPVENTDININVRPPQSYSTNKPMIKPAPRGPAPPRVRNQSNVNANIQIVIPTPSRNINEP